jgi:endogenous inhibitor of DNA gyrase (YacG/DUF329 family)
MSKPHPLTGCSHLHGMAVEKPKKNRKKKHLDRLTRDAIAAQEAGMSYGQYKALHPHTPEEDDEEEITGPLPVAACPGKRVVICKQCGKPFAVGAQQSNKLYCSDECRIKHSKAAAPRKKRNEPGKTVACAVCGAEFKTTAHNRIYCSTECYAEGQRRRNMERYRERQKKAPKKLKPTGRTATCTICGATFTPANGNSKYCSHECRAASHRQQNGEYYTRKKEKEAAKNGSN